VTVRVKRIYDDPAPDDGHRVLVDRLWPRGITKDRARVDHWLKDVAPSTGLRRWFHSPEGEFDEFARRYAGELAGNPALAELRDIVAREPVVTLLYGAKAPGDRNHATVLARHLQADQT
jgi:DNA-3-methyladenine glycosylase